MVPITIGLGLINFNAVVDTFFAARLIDRYQAPSAINAAFRLYMLPQGMFSVAVATVLFPSLARLATRGRLRRLPHDGRRAASGRSRSCSSRRASSARCSPSRSCALVYQRGDFTPRQTPVVAGALAAFALGLVFNGFMLMLNRAFFSLQSPWIPTWVALGNLGLNAVLDAAFYRFGIWGMPLVDVAREHRRHGRAARPAAPAAGPPRAARERIGVRAHRRGLRCRRRGRATASGAASTRSSAAVSPAQIVSVGTALLAAHGRLRARVPGARRARAAGAALAAPPAAA